MKTIFASRLARLLFASAVFFILSDSRTVLAQTRIDIMVVYTAQARNAAGGTAGILSRIDAAMAQSNQSLSNSNAGTVLRLVHTAEVNYTETGDLVTELERLTSTTDSHMTVVHSLRDQYGADLVALLTGRTDTAYAGVAWLMKPAGSWFAPYGFSVTRQDYATLHTFIHEIGHNLGSNHAPGDSGSEFGGAYDYSFGHRFWAGGTQYRTVMAYAPGTRISYFSNPSVAFNGTATGVNNQRDNARSIRNTRDVVAAFRDSVDGPPMQFRAVALTNNVMLRWSAPIESGLPTDLVQVRYATDTYPATASQGTDIYTDYGLYYEHTGLTPGQTYYYSIFVTQDDGATFVPPP